MDVYQRAYLVGDEASVAARPFLVGMSAVGGEFTHDGNFDIAEFGTIASAHTITLAAPLTDANTPENPTKISPQKRNIEEVNNLICDIPEYSYTILVVSK